ncbi:MAG: hypothetical protein JRJ49_02110 [Deltaproteobacteria bacterium]|nr:hypothetical protein [Deltaproteobacteria bacterium]
MMMLQSFSRDKLKKEDLKFFQDNGAFPEFFPAETNKVKQEGLYNLYPNLDLESKKSDLLGIQIKTSYGNVVKLLEPFMILDEGHKAKSKIAEKAVSQCNPACICELSATPHEKSNILFSVVGRELADEEMIKLDLNIIEKNKGEWKRIIDYTVEELDKLQKEADLYLKTTGIYIRPTSLIQVEATSAKTKDGVKIHSDDVADYLMEKGIAKDQIAIKTSSKNEIEGIDLLSNICPVRFIITKQALQEGWDCPFAYILTTLGGSRSYTALTQILGRVLRQPYGRKTRVKSLDESYVLTFRQSSKKLLNAIKKGFELDGMGDMINRINSPFIDGDLGKKEKQVIRNKIFEKSLVDFFLPAFVVKDKRCKDKIRIIDFNKDILPYIDFDKIDFSGLNDVVLPKQADKTNITALRFAKQEAVDKEDFLEIERVNKEIETSRQWKKSFFVRNIGDFVPNPWVANEVVNKWLKILKEKFTNKDIATHQIYLLEYIRKILAGYGSKEGEINRLAREVFETRLKKDEIRFVVKFDSTILTKEFYFRKEKNMAFVSKSLFKPEFMKDYNRLEEDVIYDIDKKENTFWQYRNKPNKKNYFLTTWRKEEFYPDFILTLKNGNDNKFEKIYVSEAKGSHLLGGLDTDYKKELIRMYNRNIQQGWNRVVKEEYKKIELEFVEEGAWKNKLNKIFLNSER